MGYPTFAGNRYANQREFRAVDGGFRPRGSAASNAAAVQRAVTAASRNGGGVVTFPAGRFDCGLFTPANGVSFSGSPPQFAMYDAGGNRKAKGGTVLQGDGTTPCISYNTTDSGSDYADQNAMWADMLAGVWITDLAFENYNTPIRLGALRKGGFGNSGMRNLFASYCTGWGFYLENCSQLRIEGLYVAQMNSDATGAMYFGASTPNTVWNHGNSNMYNLLAETTYARQRGIVYQARVGAKLNFLNVYGVQCNQAGSGAGNTYTSGSITFTGGSPNIPVTLVEKFPIGLPVYTSATIGSIAGQRFLASVVYFVCSNPGGTGAGNIQLAASMGDTTPITPNAGGSATLSTMGFAGLECVGLSDTSSGLTSYLQDMNVYGVDLEAPMTCRALMQACAGNFDFGTVGGTENVEFISNFVFRKHKAGSRNGVNFRSAASFNYDNDDGFSAIFGMGSLNPTNPMRNQPINGLLKDNSGNMLLNLFPALPQASQFRGIQGRSIGSSTSVFDLIDVAFAQRRANTGITATKALFDNEFGTNTLAGSTASQTLTVQIASAMNLGCEGAIVNASTQPWTISGGGSQLWGRVTTRTSFTLPAGASVEYRMCYDGTNYFPAVIGNNGATGLP